MTDALAKAAFAAITQYFQDPANKAEFEQWLRHRQEATNVAETSDRSRVVRQS